MVEEESRMLLNERECLQKNTKIKTKVPMKETMLCKILSIFAFALIAAILSIYFLSFRKGDIPENGFPSRQGWWCENSTGTPCKFPTELSGKGRKDYYYKGRTSWNCTDRYRQVFRTYDISRITLTNDNVSGISKCMDVDFRPQVPATPCISGFEICIEDPRVPAVTLTCRHFKDMKQIRNENSSPDTQNGTCNTDGEIHTYFMNTGYSTTKIYYNNEEIRWEKPILPDS